MNKRWIVVVDEYKGIKKNAINLLVGEISARVSYPIPVKTVKDLTETDLDDYGIIAVGESKTHYYLQDCENKGYITTPKTAESFSIYVGDKEDKSIIAISGADANGVLYGCVEFCAGYLSDIIGDGYIWGENYFENVLEKRLPKWQTTCSPAVKTRGLWTWGHVIYDYRNFFKNMAKMRLNQVVIWNDYLPFNAKDVVEYAHSFGIKVVWGFAWGWVDKCADHIERVSSEENLKSIKRSVIESYKRDYADTNADGIYFQSFTELEADSVGDKCIAQTVANLVNEISNELLKEYPDLHIEFGLHATSVKNKLEFIKTVNPNIYIVWEDCGAFPYSYYVKNVDNFSETCKFTQKLLSLRGNDERFGTVLKGTLNLDWETFEYQKGNYILGEYPQDYISTRYNKKKKIWKIISGDWLENAGYLKDMISIIAKGSKNAIVEALVEDGIFEKTVALPVAIYAECLWDVDADVKKIIRKASKNIFVEN